MVAVLKIILNIAKYTMFQMSQLQKSESRKTIMKGITLSHFSLHLLCLGHSLHLLCLGHSLHLLCLGHSLHLLC